MKRYFSKILLNLGLLLPSFTAFNCVDGYRGEEIRVSNFMGDVVGFDVLRNFIFSTQLYHGEVVSQPGDYSENIDQWYVYCADSQIRKQDIYHFLYEVDAQQFNRDRLVYVNNNSFVRSLQKRKEAWEYIKLIKSKRGQDFHQVWDDFGKGRGLYQSNTQSVDLAECDSLYKVCKDAFLKKRYGYQLLVASYYSNDKAGVQELFRTHFANMHKDWLDYSAQHYYAYTSPKEDSLRLDGIIHGKDKVFANISRLLASPHFDSWMKKESNPKIRSYLLAIKSLRNPGRGLEALQQIMSLYPQNTFIPFLINREINKIEDWILTPKITGFPSYVPGTSYEDVQRNNWFSDLAYSKQFLAFVEHVPTDEAHKLFMRLARVYLHGVVYNSYQRLEVDEFKSHPKYYLQARVIDLILELQSKSLSSNIEAKIMEVLPMCNDPYYRSQLIRTASQLMLGHSELRAKGFMLHVQGGLPKYNKEVVYNTFYIDIFDNATVTDIDGIIKIIRKQDKSALERYISQINEEYFDEFSNKSILNTGPYDTLKILDIKAVKYIQKDALTEAVAVYNSFPPSYWKDYYYDDPFTFSIFDGHNHAHTDKVGYTKISFLKKLIAYKNELALHPGDPLLNYYVGNAYMSMTYYGKNWYMVKNYWSASQEGSRPPTADPVERNYFYCEKALIYYKKALAHVKEAKLRRMLQLNIAYIQGVTHNKPLKTYLDKGAQQYYQEVSLNCDLYAQYLDTYRHIGTDYAIKSKTQWSKFRFFELY
ncbi:MAG TPA: hypothetical protein VL947_09145 [Cytophagales bacterium]|nr:hypothetical protein [Cytophagales bacterium]